MRVFLLDKILEIFDIIFLHDTNTVHICPSSRLMSYDCRSAHSTRQLIENDSKDLQLAYMTEHKILHGK